MADVHAPKVITLACLTLIAVALGGLLVGFGQPAPGWKAPATPRPEMPAGVLPAVSYLAMDGKARGPNRVWSAELATLVSRQPGLMDPVHVDPELRAAAIARRASRRAFSGAPPVIPHPVDANDVTSCYQCHGEGKVIDSVIAPKISHPRYTNCTQCHAPVMAGAPGKSDALVVENSFKGVITSGKGTRAYLGAPPTVPHPTLMRENCMACHGLLGTTGLRTPHPWRVNCLQCHTPDAALEQQKAGDQTPPPWAGETGKR